MPKLELVRGSIDANYFLFTCVAFQDVSERIGLPGCFILGAGAGSKHVVGVNCEMMPNLRCDGKC